ncbi:hypothetical protein K6V98_03835 [Collinsella sp. AGMB00827]|uniref:PSP1 C-terminal domain-containing protein n=1 Tax=Collinsella ureilytica TaxID=2869515 RepID=A0ABS7MJE2_9ACTN|nr:regulatory iron-sulfur-containing complex subunit RicT [Collinsella urealyticum]MBY4797487.1 hypothetical protein [Collinsella urealyticum]
MPIVVPVKFPFASRDLWFAPCGLDIVQADYAICQTERGTEIGLVVADPFEVSAEEIVGTLKPVIRIAEDVDLVRADELAQRGEDAMTAFREITEKNDLDMKPVGVEFLFGGERAVFYFAAEERVDFRQLVRDLSAHFHIRVDMRQIGVRDETRLSGGYATCGQELCCARFGGQFEPVSIRMAKEQDLPLNSAKISGMCGRLMCCLRYEFEAYKDFKSRAPKKKTLIDTPLGKARIQEYDTPREQLILRLEGGRVFRVSLADMSCSESCQKKAEAQGCRCRPDCVTRDIMDRIESPEIKLALVELDRKNGVDVGDSLDSSDRIAMSGPTPKARRRGEDEDLPSESAGSAQRRRRSVAEDEEQVPEREGLRKRSRNQMGASDPVRRFDQAGAEAGRKPRRRRTSAVPADVDETAQDQRMKQSNDVASRGAQGARGERSATSSERGSAPTARGAVSASREGAPSRRRRRRMSDQDRDEAFRRAAARDAADSSQDTSSVEGQERSSAQGRKAQTRRRRGSASTKPETLSVADQLAEGEVRVVRRRPGDGGGQAAQEYSQERSARKVRRERPSRTATSRSSAHETQQRDREEGTTPSHTQVSETERRVRRRRTRKPRPGGSEPGEV